MSRLEASRLVSAGFRSPVCGFSTTRQGGVSQAPFDTLNLGANCGDRPEDVGENRRRLEQLLPGRPCWLRQVHGRRVIHLDDWHPDIEADAAWTDRPGQVACVLTADCLPVLLADHAGRCVAAVHAGWRGLAAGVLEATVLALPVRATELVAWLGPRIGQAEYEVGPELAIRFPQHRRCFVPGRGDRLHADLAAIAHAQLQGLGVGRVRDCGLCAAADDRRFFSYRRDGDTGRMASAVFISNGAQ